jgi:leucyl aminopeptidase
VKVRFARESAPDTALAIAADSVDALTLLDKLPPHAFKGEAEEVLPVLTEKGWRILVGMGERTMLDFAALRRIGGALFAEIADKGFAHLSVALQLTPAQTAQFAYGVRLRSWRPSLRYRQTPDPEKVWHWRECTMVTGAPAAAAKCFERLDSVACANHFARDLVVAPGNELTPTQFVEELAKIKGVTLEVVHAKKAGLNLLQAVGQASQYPPVLAILQWQGGKKGERPVVFVGKGITFDTGGIDIKPRLHLEMMKGDMGGAAAVAGALMALADRNAPVNAVGILAIAENMVGSNAVRPGDVVTGYSGKTVEIIDTDAEGRLVLADALAYSAARFKPALMVDLATLTGAVEVTLGFERAGLFCADDGLAAQLMQAGEAEGEKLWRLPLTDRYDEALASLIADLRNCTWDDGPDALHAARFLQHFVPEGVPWAHLDIAGLTEADEDGPLAAEGATGFGVRLLDRLVADLFESGL